VTPDRNEPDIPEEPENGVLEDTGRIDTAGIGQIGGGHLNVSLPVLADDEDDFADDGVVDEDIHTADIVLDLDEAAAQADALDDVAADAGETDAAAQHADEALAASAAPSLTTEPAYTVPAPARAVWTEPAPAVRADPEPEPARAASTEPAPAVRAQPEPVRAVSTEPARAVSTEPAPAVRPEPAPAARTDPHEVERVRPRHELTLASKRLGELEVDRESPDLLTADRLLDPHQVVRPEPEGAWRHFLYSITGKRINLGDSRRARARKLLDRRIAAPLPGGARFVAVVSRKGGVGKTTVTALLGMALADAREDRVIAVDANPDRGTLAERIARPSGKTVRDLVRVADQVAGYNDISTIVARDETRLDVLASDSDPRVSEAFSDADYREVARIAAHYYSVVLTDTGTGIVHSVMGATLDQSDQLVVVAGLSVDEARLASETLTWLETNGYADAVRNAVVVLNQARPGSPIVRPDELEAHFRTRVRDVVRIPYDPLIAAGSAIAYRELQPATRAAARELAAKVVEGLRSLAPAA
jgi:MinD-like ATPase involved in chromosome partitioning or flagellar assembly